MISDNYTGDHYSDDALAELEANMSNPRRAQIRQCALCGTLIAFRAWPVADPSALEAFLTGLAKLEAELACPVFGIWMDQPDRWEAQPDDPTNPCELWRAGDRVLIGSGGVKEMAALGAAHTCSSRN
jgi:hypothetical protein